jgi:hypothetical protein
MLLLIALLISSNIFQITATPDASKKSPEGTKILSGILSLEFRGNL